MKQGISDQIQELVSKGVYDTVDKSTGLYVRLGQIQDAMNRIEDAGERLKTMTDKSAWCLVLGVRGNSVLKLEQDEILAPLILEILKQLTDLLEAVHYSERKQTIIDFNNSLKESTDGKSTEE